MPCDNIIYKCYCQVSFIVFFHQTIFKYITKKVKKYFYNFMTYENACYILEISLEYIKNSHNIIFRETLQIYHKTLYDTLNDH